MAAKDQEWITHVFSKPGCTVHAYDHKAVGMPIGLHPNLHFHEFGVGPENEDRIRTLATLLESNGHAAAAVNYVKVFTCLPRKVQQPFQIHNS